ncbi:hypothetical protein G6F62_003198 [Rhizopus arrhizus]|nr:hypothetical protein G6F24_005784 [Rhizopus arrhizus]KAG0913228.1 hypothetical protein G6F33_005357 [Rhizopus arrhizus]KAG0956147.1 hypothetical protein G6F32_002251 [Rhizopus arrhizus]KAG1350678.1 hypothetical protein G6F62_003198 [Rhizopus arrhizus]KAG1378952.1 hypothetical protein G6F61_005381 [Rhizopus arrhizus]
MPWSQVVARKRTSLMNATFENNIHNSQQDKILPSITFFKDGITFENNAVRLLPCRALDPAVPLVQLRLSNLPFLKEEILKEQLKKSLKAYGSALDLGILRKSHTCTYIGTGYAILSSEDKGFYAVWSDVSTYCRYYHAEGHAIPDCPKKRSSRVCWNCRASGHIAAECAKNKTFKKARKTPTAPQDRVDQEDDVKVVTDVAMRETSIKRNYTLYTDQDKLRFLKLLLDKCLSASAAAKQLSIHVRAAQRWSKQYNNDPDSIFAKHRKTGRPRLLNEEHKKVILDCIDENPSVILKNR